MLHSVIIMKKEHDLYFIFQKQKSLWRKTLRIQYNVFVVLSLLDSKNALVLSMISNIRKDTDAFL